MRFLKKTKKAKKIILVLSDLHLGAGVDVDGRVNPLEDFHSDKELVDFFSYYSSGEYQSTEIELIINGDFLDLLAVPFVPFFDDDFWSEKAALKKLERILDAHPEVMESLNDFLSQKNKSLVYIIGNHDAELLFPSLKERFIDCFDKDNQSKITLSNEINLYEPTPGVYLQHGHEYESLHAFSESENIVESTTGEKYFLPPWGSLYVTHIINKYKMERDHANAVRPIKKFLIHGLIFDTFFILRFMVSNFYFYFMVRFLRYYRLKFGIRKILRDAMKELTLFQDYEALTRAFFQEKDNARVLVVGHTHEPIYREYADGTRFINTGTWTRMVNLDLSHDMNEVALTYAKVQIFQKDYEIKDFHKHVHVRLNKWVPKTSLPYEEYR